MATIDLTEAAQRARAAGKSAEDFVRACFEGDPSVCRTPTPAGPVPIPYPNVSVVRQAGGLPNLQKVSNSQSVAIGVVAGAAAETEAALEALIVAFSRALNGDHSRNLAVVAARLDALEAKKAQLVSKVAEVRMTQEEALLQLMAALYGGYASAIQPALETVLNQAQRTFGWQQNDPAARRELAGMFVLRLARGAMRAFGLSARAIGPILYRVATTTPVVVCYVVAVVICLFSFGASSSGAPMLGLAVASSSLALIVDAVAEALAAGLAVEVVVRTGVDFGGRSAVAWAEIVCDAWRRSPGGTALGDLVRSLRRTLGLTAVQIAAILRNRLGSDASTIARALKDAGCTAHDVAAAFHDAGFSAADAARALKDLFLLSADQLTSELTNARYGMDDVLAAVTSLFGAAGSAVASFLGKLP